jgi:hypothetical protein
VMGSGRGLILSAGRSGVVEFLTCGIYFGYE